MSSRDKIFENIRKKLPKIDVSLPEIKLYNDYTESLLPWFKRVAEERGAKWVQATSYQEVAQIISALFPDAKIICSAVDAIPGNRSLDAVKAPRELEDVDIGVVRAQFGVAENAMLWMTQHEMRVTALGYLPQHLVVILDPKEIVGNMHEAYQRLDVANDYYGTFMSGPSATADIEGVLVRGAQGVRSLTVMLLPS